MNKSTSLILIMLACSTFFFSGCVVPADGYYSDPYYSHSVVVVPALPYTVNLYDRAYYNYRGYYYFYNNQRWYYSRTKGGHWISLPRTHWPHDTKWHGRHFYNDHLDPKHGGQKRKYRFHEHPHRNDKYHQNKDPRYKNSRREDSQRLHKDPKQKDKRRDEKDQKKKSSKKRALGQKHLDPNKTKRDRNNRKQRKMHTPKGKHKQRKDGNKRTEDEIYPNTPEFKRR